MIRSIRYYLARLGLVYKSGEYSFYFLDGKANFISEGGLVRLREVENVIASEEIFGWISVEKARQLVANPFHRFFVLYDNDVIVASCWVQLGNIDLDFLDSEAVLPSDTAYITHVIVKADHRNRGYSRNLLGFVSDKLKKEGFLRIYICCDNRNLSMRKIFSQLGFCYYYGVRYFRLIVLSFYQSFCESGCTYSFTKINPFPEDVRFLNPTWQNKDHS